MNFNVYIVDDNEAKVCRMVNFLEWLHLNFSGHTFTAGFYNPKTAPWRAEALFRALRDPVGVLLLDANMESPSLSEVAAAVSREFTLSPAEVTNTAAKLVTDPNEVELAAAVFLAAKQNNRRMAWISNITVALTQNVVDLDIQYPNLRWPEDCCWSNADRDRMARVLRVFHEDPETNDTVVWALQPPDSLQWEHNKCEKKPYQHSMALSDWLTVDDVDDQSAKALLCGSTAWKIDAPNGTTRELRISVLSAACAKLGIPLKVGEVGEWRDIRVPCEPFLPFLMSLKALFFQMRLCERFHAPPEVILERDGKKHRLVLALNSTRKGKPGEQVSIPAFRADFERARTANNKEQQQHLTTARLVDLIHARVALDYPVAGAPSQFFTGTDTEIAAVDFIDSSDDKALTITWTSST